MPDKWSKPQVNQVIHRMENDRGRGPYQGDNYELWHGEALVGKIQDQQKPREEREGVEPLGHKYGDHLARHPDPVEDIGPHIPEKKNKPTHRFAFSSVNQAHAWFNDKERTNLERGYPGIKGGFKLRTYEVPHEDVMEGKSQVMYKTKRAKRVD